MATSSGDGKDLSGRLKLSEGLTVERLSSRRDLLAQMDDWRRKVDGNEQIAAADRATRSRPTGADDGPSPGAFNLDEETPAMRDRYGRYSLGEKALLARRLVEAGSTFVTVSGAWGYFDHHGDEVKWGRHQERSHAAAAHSGPHAARHRH